MWTYEQSSGWLIDRQGQKVAQGYSGAREGKNNPAMQDIHNVGPIPQGIYTMGEPRDTVEHGPYFIPLSPDAMNEMFGRGGFGMHGDSIPNPGTASEGCIIQPFAARKQSWESGDHVLRVILARAAPVTDPDLGT